ncbi:MAG: sugar isomerase [Planctomycetaceae bacterium]|nr:sugar isomerase [Planctomycetaceae bacterium]
MAKITESKLFTALDGFEIELPSWGFSDTGTRFGKFFQPAAASTLDEKLEDAGLCHKLTGACPSVATHTLWDFDPDMNPRAVARLAKKYGIKLGAMNPNVFQDQIYKLGSLGNPDPKAQQQAIDHMIDSVNIGRAVGSKYLSLWFADGTNYPGQDNLVRRKRDFQKGLKKVHDKMPRSMTMLVEYKPFEPGFYHTDIADWGMAYVLAKHAGPRAKVLVDTGHHLQGTNVEHIVGFLLDENMLGGFHFNDRKYADDDLTMGSIDPYAVFRCFNMVGQFEFDTGKTPKIGYMVDQSHNLKSKVEAMITTVDMAQRQFLKTQLVDRRALARAQKRGDVTGAENLLIDAYETDVRKTLARWRRARGLPADPLAAYRKGGYEQKAKKERTAARKARGVVQSSGGYA